MTRECHAQFWEGLVVKLHRPTRRISNDGSERRIAPQALATFKARIRNMTRRRLGKSLPQVVEELRPYLIGWRSYFGFCQTPRVLAHLGAWIRRRLRMYLGGSGRTGRTSSRNCVAELSQSSWLRSLPVRRRGSGECQDIRRCKWHCATTPSTLSVCLDSMCPLKLNPSNRRGT